MKKALYLLTILLTFSCLGQIPPADFPDGVETKLIQLDTLTTAEKLALPQVKGTVVYDVTLNALQSFDGTSWVSGGGSISIPDKELAYGNATGDGLLSHPNIKAYGSSGWISLWDGADARTQLYPSRVEVRDVNDFGSLHHDRLKFYNSIDGTIEIIPAPGYTNNVKLYAPAITANDTLALKSELQGLGGINNIVEDTTPELGGNLNVGLHQINGVGILDGNQLTFESNTSRIVLRAYSNIGLILDKNSAFADGSTDFAISHNSGVTDLFNVREDGLILAPETTIADVDAGGNASLITKEYADANYSSGGDVTQAGDNNFTGNNVFNSSGVSENIRSFNSYSGSGIYSLNSSTGAGIYSINNSTGVSINSTTQSTGDGIVSNGWSTGRLFVGQNNGTDTFEVTKEGNVTANSFIGDGSNLTGISSGHTIQENGTPLADRVNLNFKGAVTVDDNAGNNSTDVTFQVTGGFAGNQGYDELISTGVETSMTLTNTPVPSTNNILTLQDGTGAAVIIDDSYYSLSGTTLTLTGDAIPLAGEKVIFRYAIGTTAIVVGTSVATAVPSQVIDLNNQGGAIFYTPEYNATYTTANLAARGWSTVAIDTTGETVFPTITGATPITGASFEADTLFDMVVNTKDGTNVKYFFVKAE